MLAPMPNVSTHELAFDGQRVTKTYQQWDRGEPRREWDALTLLHRHQPGLAPEPLEQALDTDPPSIVMARVPGVSLADVGRVSRRQSAGILTALDRLHTSIPPPTFSDVPRRRWHVAEAIPQIRTWMADSNLVSEDDLTRSAATVAGRWLASPDVDRLGSATGTPVFTHADGNLSNFIWCDETGTASIVDFEDAGRSDRAYEMADLVEHISAWIDGSFDTGSFIRRLDLDEPEQTRLRQCRRLFATYWLLMLLPGSRASARNPPGTLQRQATRLLELL